MTRQRSLQILFFGVGGVVVSLLVRDGISDVLTAIFGHGESVYFREANDAGWFTALSAALVVFGIYKIVSAKFSN